MQTLLRLDKLVYFTYNGTRYFYVFNAQNDITHLVDDTGNVVASYLYDAWGNHQVFDANGVENTNADFIGNINPIRYRGYYFDVETNLYYLNSRYYDPEVGRFISLDAVDYLAPDSIHGLNLFAYCFNNPIMYADPSGHMPEWLKWVVGGLAIAGLIAATVLTFGVAGPGAIAIGASMLTGGLVSAGINIADQLHDGGKFNWTELAISTLSGTAYGLIVGISGGVSANTWSWGAFAGKLAVAGGTSLLNSWNENATFGETMGSLVLSLVFSGAAQDIYLVRLALNYYLKLRQEILTIG